MATLSDLLKQLDAVEQFRDEYAGLRHELGNSVIWKQRDQYDEPVRSQLAAWEGELINLDDIWANIAIGRDEALETIDQVRAMPGAEALMSSDVLSRMFEGTKTLLETGNIAVNALRQLVNSLRQQGGEDQLPGSNRLN